MWEKLQASQLIVEFGRREPEALGHAPPTSRSQMNALFAEPATQCTVDFEYASCFPCRSTDAAAVLLERCLFVSALMNETKCAFEAGFFNSTAGATVT